MMMNKMRFHSILRKGNAVLKLRLKTPHSPSYILIWGKVQSVRYEKLFLSNHRHVPLLGGFAVGRWRLVECFPTLASNGGMHEIRIDHSFTLFRMSNRT
jgi:hypothetical protein